MYTLYGRVVRITKTDKCNSSKQSYTPPPLLFLFHCELAQAWHEELQGSHVTQHTLTSVIRLAAIQFRADQCLQHKQHPGQSERERIAQMQGWAILQTAVTDST